MKTAFNPARLDVSALARDGASLQGELPLAELSRLKDLLHPDNNSASERIQWQAAGELRQRRGDEPQVWLQLSVQATAPLQCQRCLQTVNMPLALDRAFRFAPDETTAAALDEEEDDDVLVLSRQFDLLELIEDELLLALPVVPRHDVCPQPLRAPEQPAPAAEAVDSDGGNAPHPFAALAALKGRTRQATAANDEPRTRSTDDDSQGSSADRED